MTVATNPGKGKKPTKAAKDAALTVADRFKAYFAGSIFADEAGDRLFWLLFWMVSYRLAFGKNDQGENHIESGINNGLERFGRRKASKIKPKAKLRTEATGRSVTKAKPTRTARVGSVSRGARGQRNGDVAHDVQATRAENAARARLKSEAEKKLMRRGIGQAEAQAALARVPAQQTSAKYVEEAVKILVTGVK